jgi:hypothetical protein
MIVVITFEMICASYRIDRPYLLAIILLECLLL